MNNAGLPGTGLGGLFYVVLALAMPVVELVATVRGRSSPARWRFVAAQFGLACAIVASVVATTLAYLHVADVPTTLGLSGPSLVLAPVVLAAVLLSCLVVVLRVWARVQGEAPATASQPRTRVPAGR